MPDEKPNKYEPVPNAPIPTYEEAIGSSSQTPAAPPRSNADIRAADPAETEGLLGPPSAEGEGRTPVPTRRAGYRPPPTEESSSVRAEDEDEHERDTFLGQDGEREPRRRESEEEQEVRREMEEMEYDEPAEPQSAWGKRISSLSASLSSIQLPFKWKFKLKFPDITVDVCIALGRGFAILLIMLVVYLLFVSDIFTGAAQRMAGQMFDPEQVRQFVQRTVSEVQLEEYLKTVTKTDHLAGTEGDYFLAKEMVDHFKMYGLEDVRMEEFGVYLNYPKPGGRKVELLNPDGSVKWKARIDEDKVYEDGGRQQTPVFHGHSKSGDVKGPLIYANYGSREDFKHLKDKKIDTKGAIALVRYYGSQGDRALKVKAAELAGFVGCIIYSDPADDGFRKGEVAPNGRYMPEGGVQRGAVSLMSWVVGDVLTPGWGSEKGAKRISKENNPGLVNIPSVPLSWGDAKHLLASLKGLGEIPGGWSGGIEGIEYWTGNPSSPHVRLLNDQDEVEQQPIWNVLGKITGVEQGEKSIIIGNHRDAWVYGAADPGSGTAVMMEVIRVFGALLAQNWRPLRTIEFVSWDGEEYNLIGSTEHVETNIAQLRQDAFAYLNMDVAVVGSEFRAAGSPVFKKSLLRVLSRTSDFPNNATMRQMWDRRGGKLDGLGAGSDYVAFQDIAGTSSLDIGFQGPPYPYHSAYDTFEWMASVGDPGFTYHKVMAEIMSLLILEFADKLIMPFDITAYAISLNQWTIELENWAKSKGSNRDGKNKWSIEPLRKSVMQLGNDARLFEEWETEWDQLILASGGFENSVMAAHRKSHNTRMGNFETHLLDLEEGGGIPNRTQFKHVVFGPQLWSGYDEAYFAAIRDAIEADDWPLAQKQLEKAARLIHTASRGLVGNRIKGSSA